MVHSNIKLVRDKINSIKKIDLGSTSCEQVVVALKELLEGYLLVRMPLNSVVFRGRRNKLEKGKVTDFLKIKELSYNPKRKEIIKIGRANFIEQSVFYCSAKRETLVKELHPKKGDTVTILKWKIQNPKKLKVIGFGFFDNDTFHVGGEKFKWGEHKKEILTKDCKSKKNQNIEQRLEINKIIDDFLNKEFRKKVCDGASDDEYKITATLANIYIFNPNGTPLAGISYPSVAIGHEEHNYAFLPKFVDSCFTPIQCEKLEVVDNALISISSTKKFDDGNIIW